VRRVENKIVHFNRNLLSDVRFENKAQMIKRNGGVIWHIERKNHPFAVNTGHESEHGIDGRYIDWVIHNDGDMDQLRAEVARAMAGFIEGSNSPESLKVVAFSVAISEEIAGSRLSIGDEIVADRANLIAGNIKNKPAKSGISEPESDPIIFESCNG
jgi:hypothetical protein